MLTKKQYLQFHAKFYDVFRTETGRGQYLSYEKYKGLEVKDLYFVWMGLSQSSKLMTVELLNSINQFSTTLGRFHAWSKILNGVDDTQTKIDVLYEAAMPVLRMGMDFPSAIKSKLVFGATFQLRDTLGILKLDNRSKLRFEDHNITRKKLDLFREFALAHKLKHLEPLVEKIDAIDTLDSRSLNRNFRNNVHHSIAPYLEIGERFAWQPFSDKTTKGYQFGIEYPVKIADLIKPLKEQHKLCISAFRTYSQFVIELHRVWDKSFKIPK